MFTALQKTVKGGILLYALLMLAIFSLLLQFYINRQYASGLLVRESRHQATAYLMAQMTLEEAGKKRELLAQPAKETRGEGEKPQNPSAKKGRKSKKPALEPVALAGQLVFEQGESSYQEEGDRLRIDVVLAGGRSYQYRLLLPKQAAESLAHQPVEEVLE